MKYETLERMKDLNRLEVPNERHEQPISRVIRRKGSRKAEKQSVRTSMSA